jgi:hypothetical protein
MLIRNDRCAICTTHTAGATGSIPARPTIKAGVLASAHPKCEMSMEQLGTIPNAPYPAESPASRLAPCELIAAGVLQR